MDITSLLGGFALIAIVLWDAFETIVLPRLVTRRIRLARFYFRYTWQFWALVARSISSRRRRENFLGFFGPLFMLLLILLWATGLIMGFALLLWGSGAITATAAGPTGFGTYLYLSGTTFFTLGLGDVSPGTSFGRFLVAFEAGMGFGFLALVISFLPLLNQSFSQREVTISLLDSRAGSPPTAAEMLRRHLNHGNLDDLRQLLHSWERWSAELLESHLSYPVLARFRSHHDSQSWIGSLSAILDTCAFVLASLEGSCTRQAQFTFAMARHTLVDLAQVFSCRPRHPEQNRLTSEDFAELCDLLSAEGLATKDREVIEQRLTELRLMYEPYLYSMSNYFLVSLPPWVSKTRHPDNWQTSPWREGEGPHRWKRRGRSREDHF
ncbi:MAG TPA: potassium channel family protein [Syntrophales bacterium]|nr:potassium channel family protein [Syntrophales bacterium]